MKDRIIRILPHINIILSLVFITLMILDWFNPYMGFLSNSISFKVLIFFGIVSIINSIILIILEKNKIRTNFF